MIKYNSKNRKFAIHTKSTIIDKINELGWIFASTHGRRVDFLRNKKAAPRMRSSKWGMNA